MFSRIVLALLPILTMGIGNEDMAALRKIFKKLKPDTPVEILYLEYPLANIGTQEEDWSAYHSGIALELKDGRSWTIDYRPRDPEHLMNFIRPLVHYKGSWPFWDVDIDWKNEAYIAWDDHIDERFTNSTKIGECTAGMLPNLVDFTQKFQTDHAMFQPISVVQNLTRTTVLSTTCHDYVQGAIYNLFYQGAKFVQDKSAMVFRDAVLVFSDKDPTIIPHNTLPGMLNILVYFRYFSYFVPAINRNFIHARAYLNEGHTQNVRFVLHSDGTYYQLFLRYPFIDYCYTTIHLPRKGKETLDLTNRFRHCKFTKAKFPEAIEGAEKISEPLGKAFSSTMGWARESLILLIPAALKTAPAVAYAAVLGSLVFLGLVLIALMQLQYSCCKIVCRCSLGTFLTFYAVTGLIFGTLLAPLAVPIVDREPNNVRNWGGSGPLSNETSFAGVYAVHENSLVEKYVTTMDFSYLRNLSADCYTLDLTALSVVHDSSEQTAELLKSLPGIGGVVPAFDGLLCLRILQVFRGTLVLRFYDDFNSADMWLSILWSHIWMGSPEASGKFWEKYLGVGTFKLIGNTKKYQVEGTCDNKICPEKNLKFSLDMILDENQEVIQDSANVFEKARAETMMVGLAKV
uniref:Uncharacterized protein n=1 Tax=Amorphochlora amoebiformis TaxID=1561963 RepID=A0A7S0CUU6_9EUKA|mmetsp:Transcript_1373/g.1946  ORF Transcript_1373/g.1946 Transcript_1373/m.1946 type:complete len:628 (+) Transcript_1373:19-1902(+)